MLKFNKGHLTGLLALISLSATNISLIASECYEPSMVSACCEQPSSGRFYVGGFGGGIYSNSSKISQLGTAFFPEDVIGALPIIGKGRLNKTSAGFGGVQVGYEWAQTCFSAWSFSTGGELEAFFFKNKKRGHLINQTVVGLPEHNFRDSFHMNSNIVLANAIISLNNECLFGFTPYLGGGIGAARISLNKANSLQTEPLEAGVNHFNSRRNDSSWAFAAQVKAGLRYNFLEMFNVFAEYRYVYVDDSNYIYGSTNYISHVPTSAWNVRVKNTSYNAFAFGVQFDL